MKEVHLNGVGGDREVWGDDLSNSGSKIGTELEVVRDIERLFSLVCVGLRTVCYLD